MNNSSISRDFGILVNPWTARIAALFALIIPILLSTGCSSMQTMTMRDMEKIQFGMASYYGKKFHGNRTACGEKYNMYELTAAHKALPFGTLVKVTNVKNGRSIVVKVNDRGPWKSRRVIDLSYAAAEELGMIADGVARVRLDIIDESLAENPLNGQEFEDCLALGNSIYRDNELPPIQLYSPFEYPPMTESSPDSEIPSSRISNELSNFDKEYMSLSEYFAGNSGF